MNLLEVLVKMKTGQGATSNDGVNIRRDKVGVVFTSTGNVLPLMEEYIQKTWTLDPLYLPVSEVLTRLSAEENVVFVAERLEGGVKILTQYRKAPGTVADIQMFDEIGQTWKATGAKFPTDLMLAKWYEYSYQ